MDVNIGLERLQREAIEYSFEPNLSLIPIHIARKISSDFPWSHSHGELVFSEEHAAKIRLLEQFIQDPEMQITQADVMAIKEAFLNTVAVFRNRIEEVSEQHPSLKTDLGNSYAAIARAFLRGIELVKLIEHGEATLSRIKAIEDELGLGCSSVEEWKSLITTNYNKLISHFCGRGWRLATEVKTFIKSLGVENPSTEGRQWDFQKGGVQYTIGFEDNILNAPRLWFKREKEFPSRGLAGLLSKMVQNSLCWGRTTENITITFFKEYTGESLGNFGFSFTDDGEGFEDVSCLDESKATLEFAKDYRDALVIVESKGRACWYVVGESGVSRCERPTDYQQTKVTLLLPIDNGYDCVWNLVGRHFNEQELIETRFEEARNIRRRKRDGDLAIRKFKEILKRVEGRDENYAKNKVAQCHHRIGNCYVHMGQLANARMHHEKAEQLIESLAEQNLLDPAEERWRFYNSVSVAYTDNYDYETAERYIKKSIRIKELIKDSRISLAQSQGSLGQLYTFWGRYNEAEKALREAVEGMKRELNEVKKELQEGIYRGLEAHNEVLNDLMRDQNYLALLYIKMGGFQEAESIFNENLSLNQSAPLDDMKGFNAVYVCCGKSKLYCYWGFKDSSEAKYQEAIRYADKGLEWYGEEYSDLRKDDYPKGLMLKYKGCALRELEQFDKAEAYLKESYAYLESLGSPNIGVIGASSRLELAQLYIHRNHVGDLDRAKGQIVRSIEVINAFDVDSAVVYFEPSITNLNDALQHLAADDKKAASNLIQAVIEHIPY